jgi:hypothetical protein
MAPQGCAEFTAESWWALLERLAEQLHRELAQLRRDRAALAGRGPFVFHGRAPMLECVGSCAYPHPEDSGARPRAWIALDVRRGESVRVDHFGRGVWERELRLEARLPEAHAKSQAQYVVWSPVPIDKPMPTTEDDELPIPPPSERKPSTTRIVPRALHEQLRAEDQRRLRDNERRSPSEWRQPAVPPRVWIDPGRTPLEVTKMSLLVIFLQEGMVQFGESPDAWAWAKKFTRSADDGRCGEIIDRMRRRYVCPEDWRGLRKYIGRICRELQRPDVIDHAQRGELEGATTSLWAIGLE